MDVARSNTVLHTELSGGSDGLLRAVGAHRGTVVGHDGDALTVVFESTAAALDCARAMARGSAGLRVAIDVGELGAGLFAGAEAGQVVVSERVHARHAGDGGHAFRELDGAWELLWSEPEPRTAIHLCGELRFEVDGFDVGATVPGGQAGSLLGYLVANRLRPAPRSELIDVVWPEAAPSNPQADLRPILSRLRRALEPVELDGKEQLRLVLPEPVWVDVEEAARAMEAARAAGASGAWDAVGEQARVVLDLLAPGFLPNHDGRWVDARRRELEELELEALEWLARRGLALGGAELAAAERAAREVVLRSPFRETGHRFLMEALAARGNVAEALRVYDELRVLLRDELGAAPAAEVQALHQRLLAGDADGAGIPAPAAAAPAPVPLPVALSPARRGAFIGRGDELEALRDAWARARAGGRGLVLLSGEPGIGKTRLTSELALDAHTDGTVLYAGCQEETLVSYQPFVEALRHYARSQPPDWVPAELGGGAAELGRLIPELAAALGDVGDDAPVDPKTRRYVMFEAVLSLFTAASAQSPLLLVLDDLHWADGPTVELLRHLMRAQHDAALLIVGAYREGDIGPRHPLSELLADLRREGVLERISLQGLDESDVGALIATHAGHEASSALVSTVHADTEGNPFFVEEIMRHLIETGVLFEREGRWTSALTADEIGVPAGVKEVLDRRLARLSQACGTALAHGAVLGREFSFEVLRAIAERPDEELIASLEEALAAQLVVEKQGIADPAYAFTHALVRETLYGALSAPRRRLMHARAAAALEQVVGERDDARVAALALHYRLAGTAGDPAKAIAYSVEAGQRAREVFAWEEAATHWDGALVFMTRSDAEREPRARMHVALSELMAVVGDLGRQIDCLERALADYQALGDDEYTAQVHSRLGQAHALMDSIYADYTDITRAFRHFDAAREVLDAGPPRRARGHLDLGVATAFTYAVQTKRGLEAGARAMEIAEQLGDEPLWAGAAQVYGWHKIVAGEPGEGFEFVERAFEAADRSRRAFIAWMAVSIRGQMTWGLGSPDEAQPFFERAVQLDYVGETAFREENADAVGRCHASRGEMAEARRLLGDARPAWFTHSLKPLVQLWDGDWDGAAALARRVLDESRRNGNRWDEFFANQLASRPAYLTGDREGARELLERALAIVVDGEAPYWEMWVRPDLARARAELGDLATARADADRCAEIVSNGEDWRGRGGNAELADAIVTSHEDRPDDAEARFAAAVERFRTYKLRADEADALHQWGHARARAGDLPGAREKLDEAADVYRRYGAGEPWLRRVSRS